MSVRWFGDAVNGNTAMSFVVCSLCSNRQQESVTARHVQQCMLMYVLHLPREQLFGLLSDCMAYPRSVEYIGEIGSEGGNNSVDSRGADCQHWRLPDCQILLSPPSDPPPSI